MREFIAGINNTNDNKFTIEKNTIFARVTIVTQPTFISKTKHNTKTDALHWCGCK